jgi:hypothetical protein
MSQSVELVHEPRHLVHLLSAPEGTCSWAAGMRQEIQACAGTEAFDADYIGHCLSLLRRTGGWRLLRSARGKPFRSFIQFCSARRPHGLGLTRTQVEAALVD